MLVTFGFILTFIAKSSQFGMNTRLYGRLGAKGLNLLCQQRNVRIMNSFKRVPPKPKTTLSALPNVSGEGDTDDIAILSEKSPRMVFVETLLASFKKKDAQKLYICENKQLNHDGSDVKGIKSIAGRLVEIKSGLRFQLVYRCLTTDVTKNLELHEVESTMYDLLANGFKKATLTSAKETTELSLRRGRGNLRVLAARAALSEEASEEAPNLPHDRKKNVPIALL